MPRKLEVGPFTYRVTAERAEEGNLGYTNNDRLTIRVDPDYPDMAVQETLLHEALHATFYVAGLSCRLGELDEELLVRTLSPALFALLRRNPKLVEYLVS